MSLTSFVSTECLTDVLGSNVSEATRDQSFSFHLSESNQPFDVSRAMCIDLGGDVASFSSNDELQVARELIRNNSQSGLFTWIGLRDPEASTNLSSISRFEWVDGTEFIFGAQEGDPWKENEPKNFQSDEACVE